MARYLIAYWLKRSKEEHRTEPTREYPHVPGSIMKASRVITILRDSEGEDHPANAGKFFLERIVK